VRHECDGGGRRVSRVPTDLPRIKPVGDRALLVTLGSGIDPAINAAVHRLAAQIDADPPIGVVTAVPAYCSLLVHYEPAAADVAMIERSITALILKSELPSAQPPAEGRLVEIPVCYGGRFGPDIEVVASTNRLSVDAVVALHTSVDYRIYMIGFTPGFPYLGGLPAQLETPRLDTPRQRIPAGTVGIAGRQTGVYPIESPGGWQLIGRTPLQLFDPDKADPVPYRAGDRIRFTAVTEAEFHRLSNRGTGP